MKSAFAKALKKRRPWWQLFLIAVACSIVLGAALAAGVCKWYWGYVFSPPAMDSRVRQMTSVESYASLYWTDKGEMLSLSAREQNFWQSGWGISEQEPYYNHLYRVMRSVKDNALLTVDTPVPDSASQRTILDILSSHPAAATAWPPNGRFSPDAIFGRVVDKAILVLVLDGYEPNDPMRTGDHFRHDELVFDVSGSSPIMLSTRTWWFDIAGAEGTDFPELFFVFGSLILALLLPSVALFVAYRLFSDRKAMGRKRCGHCPKCNYDLRNDFTLRCPECGFSENTLQAASS